MHFIFFISPNIFDSIVRKGKEPISTNCGGDTNSSVNVERHHRDQQSPGETSEISTTTRDRSDSYMSLLEYETESDVEAQERSGSEANFKSSEMKSDSNPTQINKKAKRKVVHKFRGFQIKCEKCKNVFSGNDELEYHSMNYHAKGIERKFSCYLCGKVISSKYLLGQHINSLHVGRKRFECPYPMCSIAFALKSGLTQHTRAIHARKKIALKCSKCGDTFYRTTTRRSLQMHLNAIHISAIPSKCPYAKCFTCMIFDPHQHRKKYVKHTAQALFKCPFPMCDSKAFAQQADLTVHTNTVHAIQIKLRSNAHIAKNLNF